MENTDQLKTLVERRFKDLQDYTAAYNKLAQKNKDEIMEKAKVQFKKDPEKVDIEAIGKEVFLTSGFHQTDIRKMQEDLLAAYKVYEELDGEQKFSTQLMETIAFLKSSLPKQFFVYSSSKEEFEEVEKGRLEKAKKDYTEKNYFKLFEAQIKRALANE